MSKRPFIEERTGKLIIPDAKLIFRNFAGKEGPYNREGDKSFCVFIEDPDIVSYLSDEGWNVRMLAPREDGEDPRYYIQVAVSYRYKAPKIYLHTVNKSVNLDEDSVSTLDYADIRDADVIINPSHWNVNGASGIKAYLDTLHVVLEEDYFASKYAGEEYPTE